MNIGKRLSALEAALEDAITRANKAPSPEFWRHHLRIYGPQDLTLDEIERQARELAAHTTMADLEDALAHVYDN